LFQMLSSGGVICHGENSPCYYRFDLECDFPSYEEGGKQQITFETLPYEGERIVKEAAIICGAGGDTGHR